MCFQACMCDHLENKNAVKVKECSGSTNTADKSCLILQGFLTRDKGIEVENLDSILKNKNIPDGQQDSFKRGFAEGFLKAQALTQRTQGKF